RLGADRFRRRDRSRVQARGTRVLQSRTVVDSRPRSGEGGLENCADANRRGSVLACPLMRIVVIAVGRLKQGPERELAERYAKRFDEVGRKLGFRSLDIRELAESRAREAPTRIAEEAAAISAAIPE